MLRNFVFLLIYRYWYENPGQFTPAQLAELKKHTLARVICDSGDHIQHVQTDVFERATYPHDYKTCNEIPTMDLTNAWKDSSGVSECPTFEPVPPTDEVCLTPRTTASCSPKTCNTIHGEYRTYDGTCNNERYPLWGASQIPFKRLLEPIYEDGVNTPVGWDPYRYYNGFKLPNARSVSQEIVTTEEISLNPHFSDLMMIYGQYLTTDIDHIPKTNSLCTEACLQSSPYCFPILAPENDPRLQTGDCIALTRSTRVCGLEPRQQLNSITSYIDAGPKYGNTKERALALRVLTDESGHLREGVSVNTFNDVSKPLLPFSIPDFAQGCNRPRTDDSGIPCFFSGDVRANENLGLAAIHTLWNREHNRVADELKVINPQWNGETLFQEARKIVIALHQKIAMDDWLSKTVGTKGMELLGPYNGYNPNIDVSTSIMFATAAMRFGHAQIPKTVFRLGPDFTEIPYGNLDLHETAFCPAKLVNEGSIDPVLRGMFGTALKEIDPQELLSDELTEHLFALTRDVALDLASLNIQRSRDHGLPGYNKWREFCNLPVANTFDDLSNEISDSDLRRRLQNLYGHPGNMDLFVAGLVEDPWYDSLVGPTFTCLLVEQFRRLRDGDRYVLVCSKSIIRYAESPVCVLCFLYVLCLVMCYVFMYESSPVFVYHVKLTFIFKKM